MDNMLWIWLGIAVVLGIIEAATMELASIWFVAGSILAMVATSIGLGIYWQIGIFLVTSILLVVFTRPLVVKKMQIGKNKTNADSLLGEVCIVTEDIDNIASVGRAKIKGLSWSARSNDDNVLIKKGERAIVEAITGVKLIVKKLDK